MPLAALVGLDRLSRLDASGHDEEWLGLGRAEVAAQACGRRWKRPAREKGVRQLVPQTEASVRLESSRRTI